MAGNVKGLVYYKKRKLSEVPIKLVALFPSQQMIYFFGLFIDCATDIFRVAQ